jgi:outer membrane biosynthesis protein TonB
MARKVRTTVVGAALVLAGLLAGLLSAQALGEVGIPGVTTVGLPTVPVPVPTTPPAPTPVPAPPPAPPTPPAPPVPTVPGLPAPTQTSTPPVPSSPPPASAQASERSAGPLQGSSSSGQAAGRREPASRDSRGRARVTRIRARSNRVTRGKHRKAARITFTLSAPGRVVFVVRGPAPSCGVAGRFSVQGHRGVNHIRFRGRVGRRDLPYGKYRITARTRGRAPSRGVVVVVGDRAATEGFACNAGRPSADAFASIFGTFDNGESGEGGAAAGGVGTESAREAAAGKRQKAKEKPDSGVLPAVTKRLKKIPEALPKPSIPGASASPPWILGVGALALLGLSALALLVYVLRYLRRFRTTQA